MTKAKLLTVVAVLMCIVLILLLVSQKSSSELSPEKFVEVYVQLSVASETFSADSIKLEEERNKIYKEAGVTPEEIDRFVGRLNRDPGQWADVWKKIVERLEQKRQELK